MNRTPFFDPKKGVPYQRLSPQSGSDGCSATCRQSHRRVSRLVGHGACARRSLERPGALGLLHQRLVGWLCVVTCLGRLLCARRCKELAEWSWWRRCVRALVFLGPLRHLELWPSKDRRGGCGRRRCCGERAVGRWELLCAGGLLAAQPDPECWHRGGSRRQRRSGRWRCHRTRRDASTWCRQNHRSCGLVWSQAGVRASHTSSKSTMSSQPTRTGAVPSDTLCSKHRHHLRHSRILACAADAFSPPNKTTA